MFLYQWKREQLQQGGGRHVGREPTSQHRVIILIIKLKSSQCYAHMDHFPLEDVCGAKGQRDAATFHIHLLCLCVCGHFIHSSR